MMSGEQIWIVCSCCKGTGQGKLPRTICPCCYGAGGFWHTPGEDEEEEEDDDDET